MTTVHGVRTPEVVLNVAPNAQMPNRVTQATKSLFQEIKETVVSFWHYLVTWIKNTWTATTFLFFSAVSYISPEWGTKLHLGYKYLENLWDNYTAQQREANLQAQVAMLTQENEELKGLNVEVARERAEIRGVRDTLRDEKELLRLKTKELEDQIQRLAADCARLTHEKGEVSNDLKAMEKGKESSQREVQAVKDQMAALETQLRAVEEQRDSLEAQVKIAQGGHASQKEGESTQSRLLGTLTKREQALLLGIVNPGTSPAILTATA